MTRRSSCRKGFWFGTWDEAAFITKGGDPGMVLRIGGIDYESLDHAARDHAVKRLEAAFRTLDERTHVYQILYKTNKPELSRSSHTNPLVQSAIDQRMAHLASRAEDLFTVEIYYVVIRESSHAKASVWNALKRAPHDVIGAGRDLLASVASERTRVLLQDQVEADVRQLKQRVNLIQQLADLMAIEILTADEAFRVLYPLLNVGREKRNGARLLTTHGIDYQLCDTQIEAHRGYLRLDDTFLKVLTLKEPPSETWPLILRDLLEIQANFTVVSEWKPLDNGKARKLIQSRRRHFHNSKTSFLSNLSMNDQKGPADELVDDSKQAAIRELGDCLTAIGHEGKYFGDFSLSVVAYDNDLRHLEKVVSEFTRAFTKHDGNLLEERYNLLNAFFATIPGNWAFNLRHLYLLNTNFADLSFLFTIHTGEHTNRHLNSEYLAVLETDQATPYYLNLHNQDGASRTFFLFRRRFGFRHDWRITTNKTRRTKMDISKEAVLSASSESSPARRVL